MALREVLAEFAVEVAGLDDLDKADSKMDGLVKKLGSFRGVLAGYAAIAGAATVAAIGMVPALVDQGAEINTIAQRLGVSTDALQQWRYMAEQTGAKANDLTLAMKMLEQHLSDSANGFKNKGFDHLGIKLKDTDGKARSVTDVLGDLADKVSHMDSEADKTALALHTMGKGGIAMLPLLKKGREGIEQLTKRYQELGGGLSEEFVQAATKAKQAKVDLSWATLRLKDHIGTQLLPAVTWITTKMADLAAVVGKVVHNTNTLRTLMVTTGLTSGVLAVKLGAGLAEKLGLVEKVAAGASRGLLGNVSAFARLNWEALQLAMKLAIVFLVLEDFYTFMAGGRSVIGAFIDYAFGPGTQDKVRAWIYEIWPVLQSVLIETVKIIAWLGKQTALFLQDMFHGFKGYGKMFSEFFTLLGEDIGRWWEELKKKHPYLTKLLEGGSAVFKAIGNPLDPIRQIQNLANASGIPGAVSGAYDAVSGALGNGGGTVVQNNNTDITVQTSDADRAAKQILEGQDSVNEGNAGALNAIQRPQ